MRWFSIQSRMRKRGWLILKWYEIETMCREEGEFLFAIKMVRNLLQEQQTIDKISQLTELTINMTEKIAEQINLHPEWDNEQILEKIEK